MDGNAALLPIIAAPAGAALPEDGISACEQLRSKLVYIGEAGVPFRYRLFQERIDRAREMLSKAKAAYDKSREDIQLYLARGANLHQIFTFGRCRRHVADSALSSGKLAL